MKDNENIIENISDFKNEIDESSLPNLSSFAINEHRYPLNDEDMRDCLKFLDKQNDEEHYKSVKQPYSKWFSLPMLSVGGLRKFDRSITFNSLLQIRSISCGFITLPNNMYAIYFFNFSEIAPRELFIIDPIDDSTENAQQRERAFMKFIDMNLSGYAGEKKFTKINLNLLTDSMRSSWACVAILKNIIETFRTDNSVITLKDRVLNFSIDKMPAFCEGDLRWLKNQSIAFNVDKLKANLVNYLEYQKIFLELSKLRGKPIWVTDSNHVFARKQVKLVNRAYIKKYMAEWFELHKLTNELNLMWQHLLSRPVMAKINNILLSNFQASFDENSLDFVTIFDIEEFYRTHPHAYAKMQVLISQYQFSFEYIIRYIINRQLNTLIIKSMRNYINNHFQSLNQELKYEFDLIVYLDKLKSENKVFHTFYELMNVDKKDNKFWQHWLSCDIKRINKEAAVAKIEPYLEDNYTAYIDSENIRCCDLAVEAGLLTILKDKNHALYPDAQYYATNNLKKEPFSEVYKIIYKVNNLISDYFIELFNQQFNAKLMNRNESSIFNKKFIDEHVSLNENKTVLTLDFSDFNSYWGKTNNHFKEMVISQCNARFERYVVAELNTPPYNVPVKQEIRTVLKNSFFSKSSALASKERHQNAQASNLLLNSSFHNARHLPRYRREVPMSIEPQQQADNIVNIMSNSSNWPPLPKS